MWAGWILLASPRTGELDKIGRMVLAGQTFAPGVVENTLANVDSLSLRRSCDKRSLAALLILYGYLEQDDTTTTEDVSLADRMRTDGEATARQLAICDPHQSFAWLSLYSARIAKRGFDDTAQRLLAMSYRTAPREAWIAGRRSIMAVHVFKYLDPATQAHVLDDAAGLTEAGLEDFAVQLYMAGSPAFKKQLVSRLLQLSAGRQSGVVDAFDRAGVVLPAALEKPDGLPWHQKSGF